MFLNGRGEREEAGDRMSGEEKGKEQQAFCESTNPSGGMFLSGASVFAFPCPP